MTRAASIVRLALAAPSPRNTWLASTDPGAEFTRETIARAMTGQASLQQLLDVVQLAFDAGRAVQSNLLVNRIHASTVMQLPANIQGSSQS